MIVCTHTLDGYCEIPMQRCNQLKRREAPNGFTLVEFVLRYLRLYFIVYTLPERYSEGRPPLWPKTQLGSVLLLDGVDLFLGCASILRGGQQEQIVPPSHWDLSQKGSS